MSVDFGDFINSFQKNIPFRCSKKSFCVLMSLRLFNKSSVMGVGCRQNVCMMPFLLTLVEVNLVLEDN